MLRDAENRATKLLKDNRATLDRVVELLLDRETIDGAELATITGNAQIVARELVLLHQAVKPKPSPLAEWAAAGPI